MWNVCIDIPYGALADTAKAKSHTGGKTQHEQKYIRARTKGCHGVVKFGLAFYNLANYYPLLFKNNA